jgi:hypothetical protein
MAKTIVLACGPHTLDWEVFVAILYEAALGITGNNTPSRRSELFELDIVSREGSIYGKLSSATKMIDLCSGTTPTSLWLLLQMTPHLDCYDRRDRVYALLSMAKTGAEGIDADYELPLPRLMHRVLSNSYANCSRQTELDVAIRCARLKEMMGLEPNFPWGADEYFAAERLARASTGPI